MLQTTSHNEQCINGKLTVALRGSSNVWQAETLSSIHIPIDTSASGSIYQTIIEEYRDLIFSSSTDGKPYDEKKIKLIAELNNIDPSKLLEAVIKRQNVLGNVNSDMSEDEYRLAEYSMLKATYGNAEQDYYSINMDIQKYDASIMKYFHSISLVHKLRETRAFVGFSRGNAENQSLEYTKSLLRQPGKSCDWLPAIEIMGEGIFFEFNDTTIKEWASQKAITNRISKLNDAYLKSYKLDSSKHLKPEFVLIHTFAHLLINQLSNDCGYGSASLRERIYCEKDNSQYGMYGVLIYTASGDSEGSLGGLVRQGMPGRIEKTIHDAMVEATWCDSDPVCIRSSGQGPESCNLAACYNCALLPETSCEHKNRLLDRGVVIGTIEDHSIGFFSELVED